MAPTVLQIGGLGPMEMGIILLIAVLLFGANKIPKLARSTGQALGEFQKGRQEIEEELESIKDTTSMDATEPAGGAGRGASASGQSGSESTAETRSEATAETGSEETAETGSEETTADETA